VWLNVFRASPRPSSGTYNCINSLRFYRWSVVVVALLVVVWDHDQQRYYHHALAVGFIGRKNPQHAFFGGEVKPSVPCCSFMACKRSLNVMCKSAFTQNSRTFLAHSSTFCRWVLSHGDTRGDAWWRKLERLNQIAQLALKAAVRKLKIIIIFWRIYIVIILASSLHWRQSWR